MPIFQWNVVLKVVEEPVMGALEELFNIFIHCLFTFTNLTRIWLYNGLLLLLFSNDTSHITEIKGVFP